MKWFKERPENWLLVFIGLCIAVLILITWFATQDQNRLLKYETDCYAQGKVIAVLSASEICVPLEQGQGNR